MEDLKRTRERSEIAVAATANVLDTRRLIYFFHVARTGSFTAAEAYLDVAQSALSRQIRQLESDLDTKLLDRTGHGVKLTEAGKVFLEACGEILDGMGHALAEVRRSKEEPLERISIAASRPLGTRYFPEVITRFLKRFPQVRISVHEASSGQIHDWLSSGEVDLAIVLHRNRSPKVSGTKLLEEEFFVIGRADNDALAAPAIDRAALPKLPNLMLPLASLGSRALLERYFDDGDLTLDPIVRSNSVSVSVEMIRRGGYCSILPTVAVEEELATGEFVARPLRPRLHRSLHLVRSHGHKPSTAIDAMYAEIQSVVAELDPSKS